MKKISLILLFFILFLLSLNSFGQNLSFGLKGGVDLTSLYGTKPNFSFQTSLLDSKSLLNFQLGLIGKSQFNDLTGLIIEPGFIQKGSEYKNSISVIRIGYIDMPILFYYSPIKDFKFEIGPEIGYSIYYKTNFNIGGWFKFKNNVDLGAIIGLSYDIYDKFNIGVRYSYGLTKLVNNVVIKYMHQDNTFEYSGYNINSYNRYIEFFIRYYIFKI